MNERSRPSRAKPTALGDRAARRRCSGSIQSSIRCTPSSLEARNRRAGDSARRATPAPARRRGDPVTGRAAAARRIEVVRGPTPPSSSPLRASVITAASVRSRRRAAAAERDIQPFAWLSSYGDGIVVNLGISGSCAGLDDRRHVLLGDQPHPVTTPSVRPSTGNSIGAGLIDASARRSGGCRRAGRAALGDEIDDLAHDPVDVEVLRRVDRARRRPRAAARHRRRG